MEMDHLEIMSKKYAEQLYSARMSPTAIGDMEEKLNRLTYSESGKSLTAKDKIVIVDNMIKEISIKIIDPAVDVCKCESSEALLKLLKGLKEKIGDDGEIK